MPYSRLMRAVLAPLRWWMVHPWAVLWLTFLVAMLLTTNTELVFRRSRFLGGFILLGMVVGYVSFAEGLRVSWYRSRVRASLIGACIALYSLFPLVALVFLSEWKSTSLVAVTQFVVWFPLIVGGAAGLEYAARAEALHELLDVPTASRSQSESIPIDRGAAVPSRSRRGWRRAGLFAGILLALVVVLVVYPAWKIRLARSRAEALCAAAVIGGSVAALQAKGENLGLAVWSLPARTDPEGKLRPATITGWSGWIFARWFCTIEHEDGKVLGKRTYFLD
jgi:hypothetical protein